MIGWVGRSLIRGVGNKPLEEQKGFTAQVGEKQPKKNEFLLAVTIYFVKTAHMCTKVQHQNSTAYDLEHIISTVKHGGSSIMLWECLALANEKMAESRFLSFKKTVTPKTHTEV